MARDLDIGFPTIMGIPAHTADIDAHMVDILQTQALENFLWPFGAESGGYGSITADNLYVGHFVVSRPMTISKLIIQTQLNSR